MDRPVQHRPETLHPAAECRVGFGGNQRKNGAAHRVDRSNNTTDATGARSKEANLSRTRFEGLSIEWRACTWRFRGHHAHATACAIESLFFRSIDHAACLSARETVL